MKILIRVISFFMIISLLLLTFTKFGQAHMVGIVTFTILLMIILSYIYFEKSSMGTKEIALIGTLSALAAVFRVFFAAIPDVKPTTFMVAVSGLVFGPYDGFLVGSSAAFLSNIFFGQGPWTPWQMFSWGLVGFISGLIGKIKKNPGSEKFAFLCFFYGFMFDWIMDLWYVLGYIKPLNIKTITAAYISGFTFDIMHAASSFVFCIFFYEGFYKILMRFKRKFEVTYY